MNLNKPNKEEKDSSTDNNKNLFTQNNSNKETNLDLRYNHKSSNEEDNIIIENRTENQNILSVDNNSELKEDNSKGKYEEEIILLKLDNFETKKEILLLNFILQILKKIIILNPFLI